MPTPGISEPEPTRGWEPTPRLAGCLGLEGWTSRALECQGPEQQLHLKRPPLAHMLLNTALQDSSLSMEEGM